MRKSTVYFPRWFYTVMIVLIAVASCQICPTTNRILGTRGWAGLWLIPVPSGAYDVESSAANEITGWSKVFSVDLTADEVRVYYENKLGAAGWAIRAQQQVIQLNPGTTVSYCLKIEHVSTSAYIWILNAVNHETGLPEKRSHVTISIGEARSFCEDKFGE